MLKTKDHWLCSHVTVTFFIVLKLSSTLEGLVVSRICFRGKRLLYLLYYESFEFWRAPGKLIVLGIYNLKTREGDVVLNTWMF